MHAYNKIRDLVALLLAKFVGTLSNMEANTYKVTISFKISTNIELILISFYEASCINSALQQGNVLQYFI